MSFWASDSRSPYGQTSLSIVAENGKQFNQNAKVVLVVQPDVTFFQPSESYLSLKVKVDHPTAFIIGKNLKKVFSINSNER